MKKLLVLVLLLLLLGGGAVGAMAVFGIGPFAKPQVAKTAAPPPPPKTAYMDMEAISIPVFIPDEKPRQVFLNLRLETLESRYKDVKAMEPKIRDVLLTDLHNVLPVHLKNRRTTDLTQLKPRMIDDIAKVMGPGVVTDVLVVEILER